ncbi:hypothetical protein HAX54_049676, partial [Datura stramonium]|nr:hypothetical protein [Datura stramonium]
LWNICEEVGVNDSRNEVQHMDALPCARHKAISAIASAVWHHHARNARCEAQQGWHNARSEVPISPVRGQARHRPSPAVGRRVAAHSSRDATPGCDIDKGDATRCNKRPKLTSHFN